MLDLPVIFFLRGLSSEILFSRISRLNTTSHKPTTSCRTARIVQLGSLNVCEFWHCWYFSNFIFVVKFVPRFQIGCYASTMVLVCFRLLQIINMKIFQIGAFLRSASYWFQITLRLTFQLPRSSPPWTCPKLPLEFSFRLCKIDFSDLRLASYCFQIHFKS